MPVKYRKDDGLSVLCKAHHPRDCYRAADSKVRFKLTQEAKKTEEKPPPTETAPATDATRSEQADKGRKTNLALRQIFRDMRKGLADDNAAEDNAQGQEDSGANAHPWAQVQETLGTDGTDSPAVETGAPNPRRGALRIPLVEDGVEELSLLAAGDGLTILAAEVGRLERMPPRDILRRQCRDWQGMVSMAADEVQGQV